MRHTDDPPTHPPNSGKTARLDQGQDEKREHKGAPPAAPTHPPTCSSVRSTEKAMAMFDRESACWAT